ncbi:hypothetical protein MPER_14069, partial [Moniliophthora perniciosa FA553]
MILYPSRGTIHELESQIENLRGTIASMKQQKQEKKKKKEKKEKAPVPSTSKAVPKPPKTSTSSSKKKSKKTISDDDVLSFEQKKDLSEAIATLEGSKLERVIQIIHEGVPEIRDVSNPLNIYLPAVNTCFQSTEEIELEIDTLPAP